MNVSKILAGAVCVALLSASYASASPEVAFPKSYREWAHAKSMVIPDKNHGLYGFHHVYVHPKALATFKAGGKHAEGAEMAVAFFEVVDKDGATHQGPLKMVAYMKKDKSAKDTGGWRYAAFDPTGKALAVDVVSGCYNCHTAQKDRDFIFSTWQ